MNTRLLIATAFAAVSAIAAAPATAAPAWTARRADAELTIFAAAPVPRRTVLVLEAPVERAFGRAQAVVLASDRAILEFGEKLALIADHALLPESESLAARIGPELRDRLERALADRDVDAAALERLPPAFAAARLRAADLERLEFFDEEEIEFYFFGRARRDRKELIALRQGAQTVTGLASLSDAAQRALLDEALRASPEAGERYPALHAAWERGDVEALERAMSDAGPQHQALRLAESERIASELAALEAPGPLFAVVGAAHLVGERGVIALLRERGFDVRRLGAEPGS